MRLAWALIAIGCSSPPAPTIPPRDEIGPPLPAATECFPPYNSSFAHDWFILADLDLGMSCAVFLEQDDCVLGIFRDCTDPSPSSRQWLGETDTEMTRDLLTFSIFEGNGSVVGRPPKCCGGELIDNDWALLECRLTACDNLQDRVHVGAVLERQAEPMPFAVSTGSEELSGAGQIFDVALLPVRQELWAVTDGEILVHELGGVTRSLANVGAAELLAAAPDESAVYVADGNMLLRIDVESRTVAQTIDVGGTIDLLEYSARGVLVGSSVGSQTLLQLRRASDISMRDAESMLPRLGAIVEIPNGTAMRAFLAAPADVGGDLMVLTSSLASEMGAPNAERSPRAFFTIGMQTIGFLADCSERSTERHCFFEIDLASGSVRRTGVPDIGPISDAAYDATRNWMVFAGPGGIGVVDRASWRPLVQRRIEIAGIGLLEIFGSNLFGVSDTGFIQRYTIQ